MIKGARRGKERNREQLELSPYMVLAVDETASDQEIRKAYLHQVRLSPPERDPEGFKRIRRAYTLLKDGAGRKQLDLSRFRRESGLGILREAEALTFNWRSLFLERVFQVLLSASDLCIDNFGRDFIDLEKEVRAIK